ncbi:MAG: S-layer protein, partial [Verrucomicrobiales bacterium]
MTRTRLATLVATLAGIVSANALEVHSVSTPGGGPKLIGPDATLQLVVSEGQRDLTRGSTYSIEPAGIVAIDDNGLVSPLGDGVATLTVSSGDLSPASIQLEVEQSAIPQAINFPNEIVPILTKHGCNGGGCHGKSEGQNGFRLSLLGFTPEEDYGHLVYEARGRRLSPAAPEHSLLLLKGTGVMPHGGGGLIEQGGHDFRTIVRWMEQGMPYGEDSDPVVERLEVFPEHRLAEPGAHQQIAVAAHYSDGSVRDVTGMVAYESNQKEMAEVSKSGLVEVKPGHTGDLAVMIRFQELVGVFRATVPLGAPVEDLPPVRNFIDELVYA